MYSSLLKMQISCCILTMIERKKNLNEVLSLPFQGLQFSFVSVLKLDSIQNTFLFLGHPAQLAGHD